MAIHPSAVIDPKAEIDTTAEIGPYVVIEGPVRIGANTTIRAHAYVSGWTEIGEGCQIHPLAVVGHEPQDFHYSGERSYCKIGNGVIIREGATVHRGTQPESTTTIGDECFLLAHSHVGHNCTLGRGVKVYNMAIISGHVEVGDQVIISGYAGVHQFVRIGRLAFVSGMARVTMDVPPFLIAYGASIVIQHNVVGLKRAGFDREAIHEIREAFRTLFRSGGTFQAGVASLAASVRTDAGREFVAFLQAESKQGICGGRPRPHARNLPGREESAEFPPESPETPGAVDEVS